METAGRVSNDLMPGDVMLDIFLRLPVKTLKRFSCVCKSWRCIFQNLSFIRNYNHNSANRNAQLLAHVKVWHTDDDAMITKFESHLCFLSNETMQVSSEPILRRLLVSSHWPKICECEGLICLTDIENHPLQVMLFNPATREVKRLPSFYTESPYGTTNLVVQATRLGYDSITNDYKVVLVIWDRYTRQRLAQLYSLSNDSWKEISCPFSDYELIYENNCSTYLNGCCHWVAGRVLATHRILAFNFIHETFQSMKFPVGFRFESCFQASIGVFDNHLATFRSYVKLNDCFEIWVMKDYGNSNSWNRMVVGPISEAYKLVRMWTGGKWLFSTRNGELKLYDPKTKVVTDLVSFHDVCKDVTLLPREKNIDLNVFIVRENLLPLNAR